MRKRDYFILAKSLRQHIGAHFEFIGVGISADEYQKLRSESDVATSLAKYLGEHLELTANDRAQFLELCGLRSSI